jgi:hypothetical protein
MSAERNDSRFPKKQKACEWAFGFLVISGYWLIYDVTIKGGIYAEDIVA